MKLFFDTKKKTMPQQVKRNEEDIETLKNKGFIVKPRGEYDEDATYHKFDLVSYDGDSYIFVSDTDAVGVPVTNGDYWQLYTSGGLNIEIGTTETLPAGSNAVVTNTGTSTDAVLNFGIPKGEQGEQGPAGQDGADGRDGTDGVGVPSGGITGQVLKKKSNTDYDTEWGSDESVPSGGTTGQVLKKKSNTDYDTEWATDSAGMENPMTSIGDMIYGGPTGTPTALAKGTAGQVLTMKQDETGPEWANASGGGNAVTLGTEEQTFEGNKDLKLASSNYVRFRDSSDAGRAVSIYGVRGAEYGVVQCQGGSNVMRYKSTGITKWVNSYTEYNYYFPAKSGTIAFATDITAKVPDAPSVDGTYTLKCVVSAGGTTKTYQWVLDN